MGTVGQEGRNTLQGGFPSLSFLETGSPVSQAGLTLKWLKHVLVCRKAQLHFYAVPGLTQALCVNFTTAYAWPKATGL